LPSPLLLRDSEDQVAQKLGALAVFAAATDDVPISGQQETPSSTAASANSVTAST
jgi:hypothetical protein